MREHNRLADGYHAAHPDWDDEQLYQAARRMVGAILQSITFNEFIPALARGRRTAGLHRLQAGGRSPHLDDVLHGGIPRRPHATDARRPPARPRRPVAARRPALAARRVLQRRSDPAGWDRSLPPRHGGRARRERGQPGRRRGAELSVRAARLGRHGPAVDEHSARAATRGYPTTTRRARISACPA